MNHARHHAPARNTGGGREGRGPTPRRARRLWRRAAAVVLAALLALQSALAGLTGGTARAAETENGDSVYLSVGNPIWYGGLGAIGTARMSVNGEVAYCSDPANETPKAGYYTREAVQTHEHGGWGWPVSSVEKAMFYGYGGPGFDADYWRGHIGGTDAAGRHFSPGVDWDGSSITSDEFYVYTHILVADRMTSDGSAALLRTSESFKAWFCWNILGYTYGNGGGSENPNAVGLAIDTLEVPAGFEIYQLDTGNNSMWHEGARSQTVVTFEYNPYVEVRFDKVSADTALTSGNAEYAYAGATYDIYEATSDAKVATVTTDDAGHATCQLKPNTSYYAVETAAPQGFVRSEGRVEFSTGAGDAAVRLEDQPGTPRAHHRQARLGHAGRRPGRGHARRRRVHRRGRQRSVPCGHDRRDGHRELLGAPLWHGERHRDQGARGLPARSDGPLLPGQLPGHARDRRHRALPPRATLTSTSSPLTSTS